MPTLALADPVRLAAVDRTGLVDQPPTPAFERAVRLAFALLGLPVVYTTLVLADRQFTPSQIGLPEPLAADRGSAIEASLCRLVIEADGPVVVDDTRSDPRLAGHPAVAGFGVATYAGVPVRDEDGVAVGTICALGFEVHAWTDDEVRHLEDLADMLRADLRLRAEGGRLQAEHERHLAVDLGAGALVSAVARLANSAEPLLLDGGDDADRVLRDLTLVSRLAARLVVTAA